MITYSDNSSDNDRAHYLIKEKFNPKYDYFEDMDSYYLKMYVVRGLAGQLRQSGMLVTRHVFEW